VVVEFCRLHGGRLKVVRSGAVLPASGSVYSDVLRSEADRVARHLHRAHVFRQAGGPPLIERWAVVERAARGILLRPVQQRSGGSARVAASRPWRSLDCRLRLTALPPYRLTASPPR
jgi:hypothetical protein